MPRKFKSDNVSGYTILLVDDSTDYVEATKIILEREGHNIITASSGKECLDILAWSHVDLVLLDYFMPNMTGEEVVIEIRKQYSYVQIVLQTGYASEKPPRELLHRLDIQGYYDKSEGVEKLLLWVDVGLKTASTIGQLIKSKKGLNYILEVTPKMHKVQPLNELLQDILWQMAEVLGVTNSFLVAMNYHPNKPFESFLAMIDDDDDDVVVDVDELLFHVGTGRYNGVNSITQILDNERIKVAKKTLEDEKCLCIGGNTIVPLRIGAKNIGIIYLDEEIKLQNDIELVSLFANQAAVAIQNAQLYEWATYDTLTGVYVRKFFDRRFLREIKFCYRTNNQICLIMLDLDDLKRINDLSGYLIGDKALGIVGKILRSATRSTDFVARYGGDEFAIILPNTSLEGGIRVTEKIMNLIKQESIEGLQGKTSIKISAGIGVLMANNSELEIKHVVSKTYFTAMMQYIIRHTGNNLYQAKREGKNGYRYLEPITWLSPDRANEEVISSI